MTQVISGDESLLKYIVLLISVSGKCYTKVVGFINDQGQSDAHFNLTLKVLVTTTALLGHF